MNFWHCETTFKNNFKSNFHSKFYFVFRLFLRCCFFENEVKFFQRFHLTSQKILCLKITWEIFFLGLEIWSERAGNSWPSFFQSLGFFVFQYLKILRNEISETCASQSTSALQLFAKLISNKFWKAFQLFAKLARSFFVCFFSSVFGLCLFFVFVFSSS